MDWRRQYSYYRTVLCASIHVLKNNFINNWWGENSWKLPTYGFPPVTLANYMSDEHAHAVKMKLWGQMKARSKFEIKAMKAVQEQKEDD